MGKARLVAEQFIPARSSDEDESLESFACRRLGREVFERLVEPIVCGIFTAKPDRLSMQAALPQFVAMEREHGSLIKAARSSQRKLKQENPTADSARFATGARYDIFAAPKKGMLDWLNQLVEAMPTNVSFRLSHRLNGIQKTSANRWKLDIRLGRNFEDVLTAEYDGCIIALNAPQAAEVLKAEFAQVASELSSIEYASSAIAVFGIPASELTEDVRCFGIVVPSVEKRQILAISLTSLKYPDRCPDDLVYARVFMGGAMQAEMYQRDDEELIAIAWKETSRILQLQSPQAVWSKLVRWPKSMPQYSVGHVRKIESIKASLATNPELQLCGNAYRGVGIPQCVHSGEQAAKQLAKFFEDNNESFI